MVSLESLPLLLLSVMRHISLLYAQANYTHYSKVLWNVFLHMRTKPEPNRHLLHITNGVPT